jgi:hypothetical protein
MHPQPVHAVSWTLALLAHRRFVLFTKRTGFSLGAQTR